MGIVGHILGFYTGYVGIIGLCWCYMGMMEKKMENYDRIIGLHRSCGDRGSTYLYRFVLPGVTPRCVLKRSKNARWKRVSLRRRVE